MVRAGDIPGALAGAAGGLDARASGKIEVQERPSYTALDKRLGQLAVDRLNRGQIRGKRFRATLVDGPGSRDEKPSRAEPPDD